MSWSPFIATFLLCEDTADNGQINESHPVSVSLCDLFDLYQPPVACQRMNGYHQGRKEKKKKVIFSFKLKWFSLTFTGNWIILAQTNTGSFKAFGRRNEAVKRGVLGLQRSSKASLGPQGQAQINFRYRRHIYWLNCESRWWLEKGQNSSSGELSLIYRVS